MALTNEFVLQNGCIVVWFVNSSLATGFSGPYTEDGIRNEVERAASLANSTYPVFRISGQGIFGYGYFENPLPWGEIDIRILVGDGTLIGIDACLPIEWMRAIADNISLLGRAT